MRKELLATFLGSVAALTTGGAWANDELIKMSQNPKDWVMPAGDYANTRYSKLNQINGGIVGDYSLLLSNNAHTGGTCFGDSGGPNFIGDSAVVAGVTSFGLNGNCAGTGGVFRVDRADVLEFISGFLD